MPKLAVVLLLLSALALAQTAPAEREIRAARERSNQALAARDVKAIGDSLAPEFVQVRGSGAFTPSRDAYLELLARTFADPQAVQYHRTPDKIELSSAAPLAAEHGHWIGLLPNGKPAYGGTYLAMWRLTESGWKLRSELYVWLTCQDLPACAEYRRTVPLVR